MDRFIRNVGTSSGAQSVLGQRLNSELGAAIGKMELDDLISTDAAPVDDDAKARWTGSCEERDVLDERRPAAAARRPCKEYGIEIVDVRLRRTNHPPAVREAIFDRILSEREKKSAEYHSEGERQAADIKSDSDRKVAEMRTEAEAEALRLRGQADAEADRIRTDAATPGPAVLRLPEEAGGVPAHPRRQQDACCCCPRIATVRHAVQPAQPRRASAGPAAPPASPTTPTIKGDGQ